MSFLGLALTGPAAEVQRSPLGQSRSPACLGGFDSTSIWHRVCAVATVFYFATHLTWMGRRVVEQRRRGRRVGQSSVRARFARAQLPRPRRLASAWSRWFVGLGPKPVFERWTYWEKFDYWAVFWGVVIIGTSGLILWFPNLFTRFLPGDA